MKTIMASLICSLLLAGLFLIAGCGTSDLLGYVAYSTGGEIRLLASAVPIEQALNDPALTDEQKQQLNLIVQARDYAEQVIGLHVGNSYRSFVNLGDKPLAWNLSASPQDALEPYTWNVPFAGVIPYLGFFSLDQANTERDRLVALKYDTLIYEVDAYSTLGLLPDPVASPLLRRPAGSLVDTVIHESLHNTVYKYGDTTFNESLATFVGRTGAIEFFQNEYGPDSALEQQARQVFEDSDRFNEFLKGLTEEVNTLYTSDVSYDEKVATRQTIFDTARQRFAAEVLPLMHNRSGYERYTTFHFNNAYLLVNVRYNSDLGVFEKVFEMAGRQWPQALALFSQAAQADDPIAFLNGLSSQ